jgi:putative transposase
MSLSNKTALAMIFKLAEAAERSWRRLDGHNQLSKLILGVRLADEARMLDVCLNGKFDNGVLFGS